MGKVNEQAVIQLIIKGEQSKTTIKEVRTTMIGLERQLINMKKADDPAGFRALTKQLDQVKKAHGQMISEIRGGEGSLSKFKLTWKDIAGGLVGGNIAVSAIQKLMGVFPALTKTSGELSDSLADISKQTGLTGKALDELNEDLKTIDTRTPIEELRKLAEVAGTLGYETREDVLSFVRAAGVLRVSLANSLGGNIEDAIKDVGKLVDIFGIEKEFGLEQSMLKVGSAINTVGQKSKANEGFLVNFAKRFAGIAPNADISIADTIGLAAASDILGQSSELSATNIGKMIIAIGKDVPYFAKVAKMAVKEFSTLLKTDGNEAFLRVLEGANSTTKGIEGLTKMLETLGIEGSEGAQVLGALAKRTELVRQQQDIANESFAKGTSVLDEFNVKNQNNQAILEKIGKKMNGWWEAASAGMGPMIQLFGRWFGVVSEMDIKMAELNEQQEKVMKAESSLPALIKRYDELSINTNKSKEEQAELQRIITEIAEIVPGAAYEFDKYGNAILVDTKLTQDFITEQRYLLETMRKSRKEELAHEKMMLGRKAGKLVETLNRGTIREVDVEFGGVTERKVRADEIKAMQKELATFQQQKMAIVKTEREISGIADRAAGRSAKIPKAPGENDNTGGSGSNLSKNSAEKVLNEREKLNDELLKNQQQLVLNMLGEHEKELQAAQNKYDELAEKAKGNSELLVQIEGQRVQEVGQINDKYNQKYLSEFDKTVRAQLENLNKQKKEENEYAQQRADDAAKRADKELFEIVNHYDKEIALARSKSESIVQLEKDKQAEIDKLTAGRKSKLIDNEISEERDKYQSDLALAYESGVQKENFIKEHLERLKEMRAEYGDLDIEQQKRINTEIAKSEKELLNTKIDSFNKVAEIAKQGSEVLSDILTLAADNESEYAEFQKAIAIFQIAIDSATAVAGAITTATSGGDAYTIALRIAAAVATVTAGMVKAKALMNEAKEPAKPAFREHGGYTDIGSITQDNSGNPQGWVSRPTLFNLGNRSYVAGEKYKKEYVISSEMLKNPAVADFAGSLEALRQQRFFANGGSTAMSTAPAPAPYDPRLTEMIKLLQVIATKPGGFNYNMFEQYKDQVDNTRYRASA